MQAWCRANGGCYRSQEPQASGRDWMLGFHKRHGFLRQMCRINHFFGSASHCRNIGSWKAGSTASNPWWLKAESLQLFIGLQQSHYDTTESTINILQSKSWTQSLLCVRQAFSAAATKGWAWCKHNAKLLEGASALRNLKLLVRSGCLDFNYDPVHIVPALLVALNQVIEMILHFRQHGCKLLIGKYVCHVTSCSKLFTSLLEVRAVLQKSCTPEFSNCEPCFFAVSTCSHGR